ncbi:Inhibitor of the KinA pathway to sporulation [Candidatus Terasakiella magnetica]|nr:Inhibitor of the KinA pathway to sporulation [Candidatus Terasakiella magnetica]
MIVVYDLEYTTWEGARARGWSGPGEHREVVQIGAVRLDGGTEASILVKPRLNPDLSAYFTTLTGISQGQVDKDGIDFAAALARLADFAQGAGLVANGADEEVLRENCRLTDTAFPFEGRCCDISPLLRRAAGRDGHVFSCDLGQTFGLALDQTAHDALGDARQVAAVVRLLLDTGRLRPEEIRP